MENYCRCNGCYFNSSIAKTFNNNLKITHSYAPADSKVGMHINAFCSIKANVQEQQLLYFEQPHFIESWFQGSNTKQ